MHIMLTQTTQNVDKELPADRLHGSTDKSTKQASQRMMVEIGVQCLGGWGSLLLFLLLLDLADVGDGGGEVAAGLDQLTFLGGLELGGVGNIVGVVVILEWRVGDWSGKILSRLDGISDIGVAQLAGVGNSADHYVGVHESGAESSRAMEAFHRFGPIKIRVQQQQQQHQKQVENS